MKTETKLLIAAALIGWWLYSKGADQHVAGDLPAPTDDEIARMNALTMWPQPQYPGQLVEM